MRKGRFAGLNIAAPEPEARGRGLPPAAAASLVIAAPALVALAALLIRHPALTAGITVAAVLLAWAALRHLLQPAAEPLAGAAAETARADLIGTADDFAAPASSGTSDVISAEDAGAIGAGAGMVALAIAAAAFASRHRRREGMA